MDRMNGCSVYTQPGLWIVFCVCSRCLRPYFNSLHGMVQGLVSPGASGQGIVKCWGGALTTCRTYRLHCSPVLVGVSWDPMKATLKKELQWRPCR